ncbi:unnamed protein product [Spirodela intermedia]|uniref:Uncharacterized protein n=1 Tax=Spirodela intermedia TaxID=51605 RepID=A0A7I8IDH1_SPIIN|nr:unnamed protein product [Spirodela intermedia]CAA6655445.1 unnamed protein product [Spirodela intermedia]
MERSPLTMMIFVGILVGGAQAASFRFLNNCTSTLWVATLAGAGTASLPRTGFELGSGASASLKAPPAWSGRFWPGRAAQGDPRGPSNIECGGAAGSPPATLVEVTLGTGGGADFYDVSLVDGFNVPVSVAPRRRGGGCRAASCPADVNAACPSELQVVGSDGTTVVACKSACDAIGDPVFCCTGEYGGAAACRPTVYSEVFKRACPLAYSYAFDDASSTFTCAAAATATAGYLVTFCP